MFSMKKKSIIIIAIVMGVIGILFWGATQPVCTATNSSRTKSRLQSLNLGLYSYYMDHGKLPEEGTLSSALWSPETDSVYLNAPNALHDAWGREIYYMLEKGENNSTEYALFSFGADGLPGGTGRDEDLICRGNVK